MALDPVLLEHVQAWLERAKSDIDSAGILLAAEPPMIEHVLFHCQQATEKSIKGLLLMHQIPFKKTHSIDDLLNDLPNHGVDVFTPELAQRAMSMSSFAWRFRYPYEEPLPDAAFARDCLTDAEGVYACVVSEVDHRS